MYLSGLHLPANCVKYHRHVEISQSDVQKSPISVNLSDTPCEEKYTLVTLVGMRYENASMWVQLAHMQCEKHHSYYSD